MATKRNSNGNRQAAVVTPVAEAFATDPDAQARRAALYDELGSTGLTRFGYGARTGESVLDEKLRQLQGKEGRELYRQMRLNHPVVAAILYALIWAMHKVTFKPVGASDAGLDKEAVDFIDGAFHDMSFSDSDTVSFIVDPMFEQGFSLVELVYKKRLGRNPPAYAGLPEGQEPPKSQYNDGLIAWRKWPPRPASSLQPGGEWQFDAWGGVQGVWQAGLPPKYEKAFIPIERLLHFTTTRAPSNGPEGMSVLRSMYWPYYFSTQIAEIEAIGIERDLAGLPAMYLGKGSSLDTSASSDYTLAKTLVTNIRNDSMGGVVIPAPKMNADGQGMLLELLSSTGKGIDTDKVLNRYHKLMALTGLAQFIFLGMENTGALATGRVQAGFFNMALNGWATNITDIWTQHATPRLLALNPRFAALEELPRWEHSDAGVPDLEALAEFVNKTVGAAVLTPDENLESYLRQTAGLPEKAEPVEIKPEPAVRAPKGAEADVAAEVEDTEEAIDDAEEGAAKKASARAERFAATRNSPGHPTFERETNAYQEALEGAYTAWYDRTARDLADAEDDEREEILAAALLVLATQMVRLGREHLPRAVTTGAGTVPPSPQTWAALQTALAENERYIADSLIPDIGARVRTGLADEDIVAGGATGIGGIFQTMAGRISLYASPFYMLIWHAYRDRVAATSEKTGQPARVRWVLDDRAHHCEDCLAAEGIYDSWEQMVSSVVDLPGSSLLADHGRCRCHIEVEVNGSWTR